MYLKKFNSKEEYEAAWKSGLLPQDNVSFIDDNITIEGNNFAGDVKFWGPPPVLVGDVAYWDGSQVKTTPLSKYNTSLGTAVGVVVVPEGFAPDGKVRICSLYGVDASGNAVSSNKGLVWGPLYTDTSLTNYTRVPTTDNNGSTSTGSYNNGRFPSDSFTGATSYVDSKAKYGGTSDLIPSPYLGEGPNPEYYKEISGYYNALSDFNGLSNTQTLVDLGSDFTAANACWKYKDGSSNIQWYLPGLGELGYIMPRFNEINSVINSLGGFAVGSLSLWSSSEYSGSYAYSLSTSTGWTEYRGSRAYSQLYVRPFALLG